MGTFKQLWADAQFNRQVPTAQLMQKLPDGTWVPYPYVPQSPIPLAAGTQCRHEWKDVPGIYKVYSNCKHCGIGKEVAEGNATLLLGKETLT
jgi:hypothetical protein